MECTSVLAERVLVWTSNAYDCELAGKILEEAGLDAELCTSIDELLAKHAEGAGAALIADEALTGDAKQRLKKLRNNEPAWSEFPLLILTCEDRSLVEVGAQKISELGNVTVLEGPLHVEPLVSAVQAALRARRRQYEIRDLLQNKEKAVQQFDHLAELAGQFLFSEKPEDLARLVYQKISKPLGLEVYMFRIFDGKTGKFHLHSYEGMTKEEVGKFGREHWDRTMVERVVREGRSCVFERVDDSVDSEGALLRAIGVRAWVCHPLIADGQLIGILSFGTRERPQLTHDELAVLDTVCSQMAVAIAKKRIHRELHELNDELNQKVRERTIELQETIDQIEAFAYSIAHDLRAPLRAMRGFSAALLEDYGNHLDPVGKDFLQRIDNSARKMDILIRDLLEYSRMGRSQLVFESVDLDEVVGNVLFQLKEEFDLRKAQVTVAYPLGKVQGHALTLQQVITNLVSNALKFVSSGIQPQISLWSELTDGSVRLWIEDNGIGIAAEHQHKIFGVFERLHGPDAYPGTGIGLAIVAKGVRRMGGSVGVESAEGKGSRFWIELPKERL